ncbi:unnamed protein product [Closterium sp. NIES-53]
MASLNVLTFDAEGRAVDFEVWLDDLQHFLQCDSKDGLSLFDLTSSASTDRLFESSAASALVAELVDFAAACRLDYAASLVAESVSASVSPPSVGGECALGTDVLEDRQEDLDYFAAASPHLVSMLLALEGDPDALDIPTPRSYAEVIEGPYSSQWQAAMDAKMASWKSTGTYVDEVPPPRANIVSGMWIFRVMRPPGSPPAFKARYVARGFSQRQGVDFFQTFSPTPKMTTLRGSLHEEIWLRRPPGFTGSFPAGTQRSLRWPVYGLRQAPREWHDTLRTTLAALGFAPSTADPSLFLRTNATLPPFYVLVYVDDLVFATADTEALAHVKSELQKRHTCTYLGPSALRLHLLLATVHSSAYQSLALSSTFGRVLHRAWGSCLEDGLELSSLVTLTPPGSSCEAEIYAGAMAAQELRWLTYLLVDLGEAPRSPPVLYVDNKAMLALCQEHRLEHRTKHIALRYFLARELQQRGQLRLAYVASQANSADDFTKALQPCDHQPCFAFLDWSYDLLFSPTLPMGLALLFLTGLMTSCPPFVFGPSAPRPLGPATRPLDLSALATAATTTAGTAPTTATAVTVAHLLLLLLPSLSQPLPPRTPPSLPAMNSLRRSGGSGDGGGGSSGSGGGHPSSRCGAVRWGVSGGGQMRVQQRQHEAHTPQQLREWYTSRGGGGCNSGGRSAAVQLGVTGEGLPRLQRCPRETLSPQHLREWYVQRGASHGSARCPYVICTACRVWRRTELPRWLKLVRQCVDVFTLDYDAILTAMYALSASAEGDCSRCVPPDPSIAAAALRASESGTLPGTTPAKALHTFTLDSGALRCFFRDSTTLTPLPALVPVRLADPSRGPVVASSSTVLPCSAVPSGSLSGLHLPSFSTNLVSTTALQDVMVTTTTPGGSSLYTLATEPPQVAESAQVSASGQVAASCSCRLLSHQTLLWHHRLGHPYLPHLRGMHSRLLVSGLPRSLPPLPPSPALPCLPCTEGRQRAAPHSSSFPPTTAPLQTLHMDVWGPARVSGQGREHYFLLPVDDYTRYTTVFPLRSKGEVFDVLIPWIRTVRLQLRERFGQDLPVLRLHSVARTSMIHSAAPHFLWPFAVRYAAHQLNLWPRVSLPKTSPTLPDKLSARAIPYVFLGFIPDMPGWQFYHPTSRRVFPSQDVTFNESVPFYRLFPYRSAPPPPPPLFLAPGPPPVDPLPPQCPTPTDVSQVDPLPGTAPVQVAVGSGAAPRAASGAAASGGEELGGAESDGAGSGGAGREGEEPGGAEPTGVETEGVELGGAESEGAESGGAEPRGAASSGVPASASPRLSPQQLHEWFSRRHRLRSAATGAGDTGDAGAGGAGVTARAGGAGAAATGPGGARTRGTGAAGAGGVEGVGAGDPTKPGATGAGGSDACGAGAAGAGAVDPGAGGAGDTVWLRPYFVPLLQQVLGVPSSTSLTPPLLCPPPDQSQLPLHPLSPLPAPSPCTEQSGGLTEHCEPVSCPVLPVCTAHRIPRSRPPPVPGTHAMALRPSSVPLRVALPTPPESSLPEVPDPECDRARGASPTVSRLLATAVTDPSFESAAASALVPELLDFVAPCRLDYATALVAESASAGPPSVGGECALGTDILEDRQEDFECLAAAVPQAITGPYSSQWQAAMDAEMASWKSTGTYVAEFPPSRANIVNGMWIFRVKRPPGSPPAFKVLYVARGFNQQQGVDYFQNFSPTPKMTTLQVLLHVAAQCDYELHSLDFSTTFLQGSLHQEIWLRRPPGFTESFPTGTQWSLRRPVYSLR